jgi:hypothetical protein
MTAPKMQPSGMINVTSTAQLQGKLELFGYGAHDGVINPGDLLILCTDYVGEGFHRQKVEFKLRLRGRDMHLFVDAANLANNLWAENKHWLNASVNTPNLDKRGKSEIRLGETLDLINKIYPQAN